ncbi:MAG TPA: hypothetical protein VE988_12545 [Gemmataceae bacterium]|nr:hypothetical protein [Gemmataceae bacterium]
MARRFALAVTGSLLLVGVVSANSGPPKLPEDQKRIDPPVRFEGVEKHADYVFYLIAGGYYLSPVSVEVKDSNAGVLDFSKGAKSGAPVISTMVLLAMDRKDFEKRAKDDPKPKWLFDRKEIEKRASSDPSLKWVHQEVGGFMAAKLDPPAPTMPITVKDVPVTTYRVTLKDGKLTAEKVEGKKSGEGPQASLLPTWAFGIVSSLSIAWLGIWFARRGTTRGQSQGGQQ